MAELSSYVDGIGPWIPQVIDLASGTPTGLVELAHAHNLQVHPYTFRVDELGDRSSDDTLALLFEHADIDGVFTDFSDVVYRFINP